MKYVFPSVLAACGTGLVAVTVPYYPSTRDASAVVLELVMITGFASLIAAVKLYLWVR